MKDMSHEQLDPKWSRPAEAIDEIFQTVDKVSAYLDHLPTTDVREAIPIDAAAEFRQFTGQVFLANEQRYRQTHLAGQIGLHAVADAAGFRPYHFTYPNEVLPFNIMALFGTDSRGNDLNADGLNVYGNPNNPSQITHSFVRIDYGDRFVPISTNQPDGHELSRLHQRLTSILSLVTPVRKPRLQILHRRSDS
jgi:hypothetical protein